LYHANSRISSLDVPKAIFKQEVSLHVDDQKSCLCGIKLESVRLSFDRELSIAIAIFGDSYRLIRVNRANYSVFKMRSHVAEPK
jgi:hypothetical protein